MKQIAQSSGTRKTRRWDEKTNRGRYGDRPCFSQVGMVGELEERGSWFAYGGLAVAHGLVKRLGIDGEIDERVQVLKFHLPYLESDHVLTHAYNLYVGGERIEDIANLQGSLPVQLLVGSELIPDPTTAGDFLRRFQRGSLEALQEAIDAGRQKVWKQLPRQKRKQATVDFDSHIKEVYGECKGGADFSYDKRWSYHPLVATLAETQEWLAVRNRPGNASSAEGVEEMAASVLKVVGAHFEKVYFRGDTAFYRIALINLIVQRPKTYFAFCVDSFEGLVSRAESLPQKAWKVLKRKERQEGSEAKEPRRKRRRSREETVRVRNYKNLRTTEEHVAEFPYQPGKCSQPFRMIVVRKKVEHTQGQQFLFEQYRYRFILTNIPDWTPAGVVSFTYQRCDQENILKELENGLEGMRMPTGELLANEAFLLMAELAWNLRKWASLLVLPGETLRWQWKRFRHAFVYVATKVVEQGRQLKVRFSQSHLYASHLKEAVNRLRAPVPA